jgi:GntR family transcriptional regulator
VPGRAKRPAPPLLNTADLSVPGGIDRFLHYNRLVFEKAQQMTDNTYALEGLPHRELSRSNGPLYQQLAAALRKPIQSGALAVGEELPREADIASRFSVSLITVRQALRELESERLIRKRSAKPAIVAARDPKVSLSWSFESFGDMASFARDAVLVVKSYRQEKSPILEQHFGMAKTEKGYCLRSILHRSGNRRTQVTTFFPPDIGARIRRSDFKDPLIFRSVQTQLGLRAAVAKITVRAELASEEVARDIEVAPGSAILCVEMLFQSDDQRNVEYSIARHPADDYSITYQAPNDLT